MGSSRRRFTDEYKRSAVELVLESGRTNTDVAKSLGIGEMTLGRWVRMEREKREKRPQGRDALADDERAELDRLRKENADLRMQVEFAKKVAAWFGSDEK